MSGDELEGLLAIQKSMIHRKWTLENELREWKRHEVFGDEKTPDAPYCLLNTELDLVRRYLDVLEREIWHTKQRQTQKELRS